MAVAPQDQKELDKLARATSSEAEQSRDWYVNSQGMTMLKIPGLEFRIGPVDDEKNPPDDAKPEPFESFWMSDQEVSVRQFQAFVNATNDEIGWPGHDQDYSPTLDHPVQRVSWYDAVAYCNWLTSEENKSLGDEEKLTPYYEITDLERDENEGHILRAVVEPKGGSGYRLPTEREWEYACRALSTKDYCWGSDTSLLSGYVVSQQPATLAGQKKPNGWGLFDMHGHVEEWCWDFYSPQSKSRVLRGGSFTNYKPLDLRSADRFRSSPFSRLNYIGFRISRTP